MKISIKRLISVLVVVCMILLSGCEKNADTAITTEFNGDSDKQLPSASREIFAMDTYMTLTCYGEKCEEAINASIDEIERLDKLLSTGDIESEVYKLNMKKSAILSEDTRRLYEKSIEINKSTRGTFDITVYPIMKLWGFTDGNFSVPSDNSIKEALKLLGCDKLDYNANSGMLTLSENQEIDFGGIAKGYTSDRVMEIFEEYDIVSGVVSLGGNVELYKKKTTGDNWRVGIQSPNSSEDGPDVAGVLEASDVAIITSGAYERFFVDELTGRKYHHIIDPSTGYSSENNLLSVTIVSSEGIIADGLSTACFIMGLDEAQNYWRTSDYEFEMILLTDEMEFYVTEGIVNNFSSDYNTHIITKERR